MFPAVAEAAAQAIADAATHASLHVGDPDTTGANEVTTGTYARQPITWIPGGDDGVIVSDILTFPLVDGDSITDVGLFNDLTAGDFIDSEPFAIVITADGDYDFTITIVVPT